MLKTREKTVEDLSRDEEVFVAERKMEAIWCVRILKNLIVEFLDMAVVTYIVLQGKDKKDDWILRYIFF